MSDTDNTAAAPIVAAKIESLLEERKNRIDRRQLPEVRLPVSVERRKGGDRRAKN